jgi:hypothetical protein
MPSKKCIPGVICIENVSLFVLVIAFLLLGFVWFQTQSLGKTSNTSHTYTTNHHHGLLPPNHSAHPSVIHSLNTLPTQDVRGDVGRCAMGGGTVGDPLTNAYVPPIKCDAGGLMTAPLTMSTPPNSIPINVPTQHYNTQYNQVGILTKRYGNNNEILPLMGRRTITSRDKWQYYTMSGGGPGGNMQSKLPIRVKGRNCSGEYGCPEVYSGDEVYVEGFQDTFEATIYESGLFSYIPY